MIAFELVISGPVLFTLDITSTSCVANKLLEIKLHSTIQFVKPKTKKFDPNGPWT